MDNFSITKFFRNQYLTEGDISIRPFDLEKHPDIKALTDELSNALGVDIEQSLGSGNYSGRSGYYMNMPREMQNWDDQSSTKVEYVFDNINKLSKEYEFEFKGVSDSEIEPGERVYPATVEFFLKEKNIEEMDINDPVLMKMRAAKMKDDQPKKSINPNYAAVKNASKIEFLKKERDQLMRDMEQEAEPEGGPIADEYGSKLNRIDRAIAKLEGRKEMTYDQAIAEMKVGDKVTFKSGGGDMEIIDVRDMFASNLKAYRVKNADGETFEYSEDQLQLAENNSYDQAIAEGQVLKGTVDGKLTYIIDYEGQEMRIKDEDWPNFKKMIQLKESIAEIIKLGEGVIEEELCAKGKAYRKKRMAAGEKSSAYLNGRAVKVCKGQMKG
jgi:uncharacterized protein YodC (DUF2158 family)